jgi:hypothetical protein
MLALCLRPAIYVIFRCQEPFYYLFYTVASCKEPIIGIPRKILYNIEHSYSQTRRVTLLEGMETTTFSKKSKSEDDTDPVTI